MSLIIYTFYNLPYIIRVAILFLIAAVLWKFLGRWILKLLSLIPFLMEKGFKYLFLLIELPVSALHKKFGSGFYKIDNQLSKAGEKLDSVILKWYKSWHDCKKISFGKILICYVLCVAFVVLPSVFKIESFILKSGETAYMNAETAFEKWIEGKPWYKPEEEAMANKDEQPEVKAERNDSAQIVLVVSGITTSLLVRDMPSTENGVILERLHNDDTVIWTGQFVFAQIDNEHVEPWAKIVTVNGVEGWSRMFYLHPEQYEDRDFYAVEN